MDSEDTSGPDSNLEAVGGSVDARFNRIYVNFMIGS
jgi:hypothetical protein